MTPHPSPLRRASLIWTGLAFLLLALRPGWVVANDPPRDVTEPPAYETFLVVPLRVHLLTAEDLTEVDCKLADADVERIIGKANDIWHKAGVHFGLESIVREPAARQDEFRTARGDGRAVLDSFRILRPEATRRLDGLHVYYVHQLPVNGVWMGEDFAFVQETAALRPVRGGIDEPVPRVTAHELGHALSLPHRQDRTNLMASGTTGTLLNEAEVAKAREHAAQVKGATTVAECRRVAAAAERNDPAAARRAWGWLASIPGNGAAEAKRRRDQLAPVTKPAKPEDRPSSNK